MFALTLTAPNNLQFLSVEEPGPLQEGELLVRMKYSSVQPLDSLMYRGEHPSTSLVGTIGTKVLGTEGVGVVEVSNNEAFPVGVQVAFMFRPPLEDFGAWSNLVRLHQDRVLIGTIPYDLVPQTAAAGITSTIMALACLRHFRRSDVIVVPGAAGAVGLAIMQLAATKGILSIGLVRGHQRVAKLIQKWDARSNQSGPEYMDGRSSSNGMFFVDVTSPDWLALVLEHCKESKKGVEGADGVVDGIGGATAIEIAKHVVRPHGVVVTYAAHDCPPDPVELAAVAKSKRLRLYEESPSSILDLSDSEAQFQNALAHMAAGRYKPLVWEAMKWQNAHECLVPQPEWSEFLHASQFTEGRIGRILLRFE